MAISTVQLYVAFSKLFKTSEPDKKSILQFGVNQADFDAVDIDNNEYLGIDEAIQNSSISELLYSSMVSTYGSTAANEANKASSGSRSATTIIDDNNIDPNRPMGNNPFV